MGKKSSKAEVEHRVHEIVKLIAQCKTTHWIVQYCAEMYGVNRRQAENYIARARAIIKEEYSVERCDFLASRMAVLDEVIEASIREKQHSNAIGGLRLQAELARLFDK